MKQVKRIIIVHSLISMTGRYVAYHIIVMRIFEVCDRAFELCFRTFKILDQEPPDDSGQTYSEIETKKCTRKNKTGLTTTFSQGHSVAHV